LFTIKEITSSSSAAPPSSERVQLPAYQRTGYFHLFVQAPTVLVCSATPPADNSREQCPLNDSVIKHAQHITADIEGPDLDSSLLSSKVLIPLPGSMRNMWIYLSCGRTARLCDEKMPV